MVRIKIIRRAILLLLAVMPLAAMAQVKVLERSSKKTPSWLVSTGNGYFVSSNLSTVSLEDAKQLCIDDIKRQIISAIAENVKMSTSQETRQVTSQSEIVEFNEDFMAKFETRSAVVPYINGISLSQAEDYYYEKTLNKSTGVTSYSYSVLYPFSDAQLQVLINKFNAQDREMEAILDQQIALLDNISSTEDIDKGLAKLSPLLNYFFDDVRIEKATQAYEAFKKQYANISLELVSSKPGSMIYTLMLNGRTITTQVKPTLRYNCAMNVMYSAAADNMVSVTYDNSGCMDGEENWIEVSYRFLQNPLKKQFFPVMTNSPLNVSATGEMIVRLSECDSLGSVGGLTLEFQLNNQSMNGVMVDGIVLKISELDAVISESSLNMNLANGVSSVKINSPKEYKLVELSGSQLIKHLSFANGSLNLINTNTGLTQTMPLVVKYQLIK